MQLYNDYSAHQDVRKFIMQILFLITVVITGAVTVIALGLVWVNQRKIIYRPDTSRVAPADIGLGDVQERVLRRDDNVDVMAWYGPAAPGQPTLLYFHGNGGNLAARGDRISAYLSTGHGVYMMSYRGYSGSAGKPTQTNNVGDAIAAYEDLRALGVPASDIILYGESLGTGVAVQVAAQKKVGGLILDAPFTTLAAAGKHNYPYLPVELVLWDRYDSLATIKNVQTPLLIIHGTDDSVVPFELGQELFKAANEPKEFGAIPNAGHSDHYRFGSFRVIQNWMSKLKHPIAAQ